MYMLLLVSISRRSSLLPLFHRFHEDCWFNPTQDSFGEEAHHGFDLSKQGLAELERFATQTFDGLVEIEPRQLGRPSSLEFFARLDISVWEYEDERFHYYVNEVSRGVRTCLYGLFGDDLKFADLVEAMVGSFGPFIEHAGTVAWEEIDGKWMAELDRAFRQGAEDRSRI